MQHALPVAMPPMRPAPLLRPLRRSWAPSTSTGPYVLPVEISGRLSAALAAFRNADATWTLAVFLARYGSAPGRLECSFPVDRRALANHARHGLTEGQVRGGLRALERIGFLEREPMPGSAYKRTETGPQRRPILFRFGRDFLPAFRTANARARAARGAPQPPRRPLSPSQPSRPSTTLLAAFSDRLPIPTLSVATREYGAAVGKIVIESPPEKRTAVSVASPSALDIADRKSVV